MTHKHTNTHQHTPLPPHTSAYLLLLCNQPPSWYFVTFAKLTPLHLQLSHPDKTETHFSLSPLQKVPFNSRALAQCGALAALTISPPRLTGRCGDGLCASCPSVGIAHQPGDSANRASRDAGCEADLFVWGKEDTAVWMSDSSLFVTGFEELTLCHFWRLKLEVIEWTCTWSPGFHATHACELTNHDQLFSRHHLWFESRWSITVSIYSTQPEPTVCTVVEGMGCCSLVLYLDPLYFPANFVSLPEVHTS